MEEKIALIGKHWEVEDGFFYHLRNRVVDFSKGSEVLNALQAIDFSAYPCVPLAWVSTLWYIPLFMEWQMSNIEEWNESDAFKRFVDLQGEILSEVERILGYP
jgi:hypothetical protein